MALPKGTRATVTKALPSEITEAVKGDKAFEPEIRVEGINSRERVPDTEDVRLIG
jgi:hypothetical protein